MISILIAIAALCVMGGIVAILFRPYDYGAGIETTAVPASEGSANPDAPDDTRWRSVRIRPGLIACRYATNLQDQVFLAHNAPKLPLAHCRESDCRCHYVFYKDRRSGFDRRVRAERVYRLFDSRGENRRRRGFGRRADDLAPAH
jgi:hypothetical protein